MRRPRFNDAVAVRVNEKTVMLGTFQNAGTCKGCGEDVWWVRTPDGANMPVDPAEEEEEVMSHFATCPDAQRFRKPRKPKGQAAMLLLLAVGLAMVPMKGKGPDVGPPTDKPGGQVPHDPPVRDPDICDPQPKVVCRQ